MNANPLGNISKIYLYTLFFHATDQDWQRALEQEQVFNSGKNCKNCLANIEEYKNLTFYLPSASSAPCMMLCHSTIKIWVI